MTSYEAAVTRDGKWWMVSIPELGGLTQARRLSEAGLMAREWIALTLGVPLADVEVTVTVERVGDVDVAGRVRAIREQRARAAELESGAAAEMTRLARELAGQHLPVRDIGAALGISFQRAHQLIRGSVG